MPSATDEDGDSVQRKKQASAKERLMAKEREERVAKLAEWKVRKPPSSSPLSEWLLACTLPTITTTWLHKFKANDTSGLSEVIWIGAACVLCKSTAQIRQAYVIKGGTYVSL